MRLKGQRLAVGTDPHLVVSGSLMGIGRKRCSG
jgi:hypothetical protein